MKEIEEFEEWYKNTNNLKDKIKYLKFVWELMRTPYTDYHYSLMVNKKTNENFKEALWSRFDEHSDAEIFLLNKLNEKLDEEYHGKILYCLGKIIDQKNGKEKAKILEYSRKYAKNSNEKIREKAIIVLGWIGGNEEIELLGNILLKDSYNKCRAWASTSFMQMSFRKKIDMERVLSYLHKSIKQEDDNFVIGCIIETIQETTKKKFGLLKKDLDINNIEAINNSKIKVLKYFEKLNNSSKME
jgi:hypothetical protein